MTTMPDEITGGVDTHLDVHVAAALNAIGGLLGVESFPADGPGYRRLLTWLQSFGTVVLIGVGAPAAMAPASPATSTSRALT